VGDWYFGRTEGEGEDMLGHLMEAKDRDGGESKFSGYFEGMFEYPWSW